VGTLRYASLNSHNGIRQSRRDDLESMIYILIYFLKGRLPWQDVKAKTKEERYKLIHQIKAKSTIDSLCKDIPNEFTELLQYVKDLQFEERPCYNKFYSYFQNLINKLNIDQIREKNYNYIWEKMIVDNINQYQDTTDLSCRLMPLKMKESLPPYDLCTLELCNGLHIETNAWELGNLDDCAVGEELGLWGFPHCTDGRVVLTFQRAELGAKLLMGNSGLKTKYGTVNILTRPGQSGSPVYSLRTGKVLGILMGAYDSNRGKGELYINGEKFNFTNQTSYFLSSEYLVQMI
jgi:hypothetical protein